MSNFSAAPAGANPFLSISGGSRHRLISSGPSGPSNARWALIDYSRVLHDPVDESLSGFEATEVLEEMPD